MKNAIAKGRCLCSQVQFDISGAPKWIGHCHCSSCRRNTGSPVTTFAGFRPNQEIYTSGVRRIYQSSPGVRRGFCDNCGTPLSYEADRIPNEIHFYVITLDQPQRFIPQAHYFYEERIAWLEINDTLPRYNKMGNE